MKLNVFKKEDVFKKELDEIFKKKREQLRKDKEDFSELKRLIRLGPQDEVIELS